MNERPARRRVVVTGMGVVSCLGIGVDAFWGALVDGRSGIGPITLCDPTNYPCRIAGEVRGWDPGQYIDKKEARRMARFTQFAVATATMAWADAGLDIAKEDPYQVGVLLGTGNGSLPQTDEAMRTIMEKGGMRVSPLALPMLLPNMGAANVSRTMHLKGYNSTVATACAASNQAIGESVAVVRDGRARVMLAGGAEAGISELGLALFSVMRALSGRNDEPQRASRPFDAGRDGFVPAEGAAVLVLEEMEHAMRRGARIYAEVTGFGSTADAFHLVQPDETSEAPAKAMAIAMEDAGVTPLQVDYINAHGTSTPLNDVSETQAVKKAMGAAAHSTPISSTKSMIGHALGAAGALEAVACIQSIRTKRIHPTINYETPDPQCDLDYVPNEARKANVRTVLSNAFGFGGQNACLVFQEFSENGRSHTLGGIP